MANKFSPIVAAFAIIDFTKAHPRFVAKYVLFYVIFLIAYGAALAAIGYFDIFEMMLSKDGLNDIEALNHYNKTVGTKVWPLMLFSLAFYISFKASLLRKMIRGEEIGFHGLWWGKDENRLVLSALIWFALYMGGYLLVMLAAVIVGAIFGIMLQSSPIVSSTVIGIVIFIGFSAFIYLLVRIGQYSVISIARRKIVVLDSWKLTKGHTWSFFLAYALLFLAYMLVFALVCVWGAFVLAPDFYDGATPNFLAPKWIVAILVYGILTGFWFAAVNATSAYAYKIMFAGEELPQESDIKPNSWPEPNGEV